MKKIGLILMVLASSALVACGAKKDDDAPVKSTSKSTSAIKKPIPSKSSETPMSSEIFPSSNQTVKTSDVQGSDVTEARLSLYEAGVNSSSISDEELLKYWDEAKKEKLDFVKYVQDKL
ncbi:hypothetical protein FACS1894192_05690 [Bacilli bacterium]|nr:hypothetical protein FACS1894192_05690 [Bacilli bacterium]